jgi:hypothetical protein
VDRLRRLRIPASIALIYVSIKKDFNANHELEVSNTGRDLFAHIAAAQQQANTDITSNIICILRILTLAIAIQCQSRQLDRTCEELKTADPTKSSHRDIRGQTKSVFRQKSKKTAQTQNFAIQATERLFRNSSGLEIRTAGEDDGLGEGRDGQHVRTSNSSLR